MLFSFSTKGTKPQDSETVLAVKQHCSTHNLNFSGIVVTLLRKYLDEVNGTKDSE
jgi:hypothetical protein